MRRLKGVVLPSSSRPEGERGGGNRRRGAPRSAEEGAADDEAAAGGDGEARRRRARTTRRRRAAIEQPAGVLSLRAFFLSELGSWGGRRYARVYTKGHWSRVV